MTIPRRYLLLFVLLTLAYQSRTVFTSKVDVPGNLAFVAYPWKALNRPTVRANTGIVFTQLVPWTRIARDELLRGHMPLWNRTAASGAPLLANQQTALFHPFTLAGLWLPIGKAFTLSACLRLFTLLYFSFVLFRLWGASETSALFGAIAYTFSVFHIVWLLFPLGLSSMMLPLVLVGVHLTSRDGTLRAHAFLVLALALAILGGHPESALWVWIVGALYALYLRKNVVRCATAFIVAMLLTAFFWVPTIALLGRTGRFQSSTVDAANPADHGLGPEWLLPLIRPNAFGTPQAGNYTPPKFQRGVVLNDYGEVASGYAGLPTLLLAACALFVNRRKPFVFLVAMLVLSFATFWELPLWRDFIHHIPLLGVSLHQRLRLFWVLAVVGLAVLALDQLKPALRIIATVAVLIELVLTTWNYNPPARPKDVFPETDAIRRLRAVPQPSRIVAWGWSFIPDTPGYYGLEDVKTTDPISDAHYMRLFRGYLRAEGTDSVVNETKYPIFDYLNIENVYTPPDATLNDPKFELVYRGNDGAIYHNRNALPRYFTVSDVVVTPDFDMAVGLSKQITDFRQRAIVDRAAPAALTTGTVRVVSYEGQRTLLDVDSPACTLLVSSDVHWPGWRVYVNGRAIAPVTVNGAFLGAYVPGGHSRVELVYRPREFTFGLRLGLIALVGYLIAIGLPRSRARSPFPAEAASSQ